MPYASARSGGQLGRGAGPSCSLGSAVSLPAGPLTRSDGSGRPRRAGAACRPVAWGSKHRRPERRVVSYDVSAGGRILIRWTDGRVKLSAVLHQLIKRLRRLGGTALLVIQYVSQRDSPMASRSDVGDLAGIQDLDDRWSRNPEKVCRLLCR